LDFLPSHYQYDLLYAIASIGHLDHTLQQLPIPIVSLLIRFVVFILGFLCGCGFTVFGVIHLLLEIQQFRADQMGHGRSMAVISPPRTSASDHQARASVHHYLRRPGCTRAATTSTTMFDPSPAPTTTSSAE